MGYPSREMSLEAAEGGTHNFPLASAYSDLSRQGELSDCNSRRVSFLFQSVFSDLQRLLNLNIDIPAVFEIMNE